MVAEVRHKLLPKQAELIRSTERHSLYSGAVGSGKSRALCIDALMHCAGNPRARYGLFRKTLVALKKSTLKTLLEGDGMAPPVLPPGSYTHNKNDCEVKIRGGGSILYSGVETPESVRSMNLSRAGFDEVTEATFDDYSAVDDRVRLDIGQPLCVKSASNPGTPSHWMAGLMGLSPGSSGPKPGCRLILTRTSDNTHLPAAYIESFARHEGTVYYRRMFLGEWCGSDGLVYTRFDRDANVRHTDRPPKRRVLGVDWGHVDPFVILDVHIDSDRNMHVAREYYETGLDSGEMIERVKAWADSDTPAVVDSSRPEFVLALQHAGVNARASIKGQGSVVHGINLVQTRLNEGTLTLDPCCTNTVREFETYEWAKNRDGLKDEPRDANNHAMDALRYVVRDQVIEAPPIEVMSVSSDWGGNDERMWVDL
jgi:PBSX family phage terminase large subunit